jgi:hypothetical protein
MLVRPLFVDTVFTEEKEIPRSQRVKTHRPVRSEKDLGTAKLFVEKEYQDLLRIVPLVEDDDDLDDTPVKTVRFLLTNNLEVKLVREGRPSPTIRTHLEMASENEYCATGGNLMFNSENKICIVTNKCSGFSPSFASLQYLLIVLIKNNIMPFANDIEFRNHTRDIRNLKVCKITYKNLLAELSQHDFYRNYDEITQSLSSKKTVLGKRRLTDSPNSKSPIRDSTQRKTDVKADDPEIGNTVKSPGRTKSLNSYSLIQLTMGALPRTGIQPRSLFDIQSFTGRDSFAPPSLSVVSASTSQASANPASSESLFLHSSTATIFNPTVQVCTDQALLFRSSSPAPGSA